MQPRGIRNNNFGNIEDGPFTKGLPGYTGSDGRFATFDTPENGMGAMDRLLANYGTKGLNSVGGVIGRWAPSSDGNNVNGYSSYVAGKLGVSPTDTIDMTNPQTRSAMARAMAEYENGPSAMAYAGDQQPPRLTVQPSVPGTSLQPPTQFTPGTRGPGTAEPASPSNWFGTGMPNGISGNFMGGLGDVGLAMIAMGDPKAAAAIGTLQKQAAAGEYDMHYDPASGAIIRTNKRTGAVDVVKNSLQSKEPSKVDASVLKDLASTNTSYANVFNTAQTAAELKDALDNGKIDPSLWGMTKAQISSAFGDASPQAQMWNKLQAFRNTLASDQLRLNTGTQTDKDFQVAKESLVAGLGSFDPKTMSSALHDYINRTRDTAHKAYGAQLQSYQSNYPDAPIGVFAPYNKALEDQRQFYEGYGKRSAAPSTSPPPLHSFKR
jgi:hypothetical protein